MEMFGYREMIIAIVILIAAVFGVFFILTLQNTLKAIEPENRTMKPGKTWLLMIPFFNYVWLFYVVVAIANSLKMQLEKYGVYNNEKPTYNLGLTLSICTACSLLPILNKLLSIPVLILWLAYWIKVNAKRKELLSLKDTIGTADESSIFITQSI